MNTRSLTKTHLIAATVAIGVAAILVSQASTAAFTAQTTNDGSNLTADTISLTDNADATALYEVAGMVPGQTEQRCITVRYDGTADADVRLYAELAGADTLASYLDLTVEVDTDPAETTTDGEVTCPDSFQSTTTAVATSKLDQVTATTVDFASAADTEIAVDGGQQAVYRFTVHFDDTADNLNDAQGAAVTDLSFTWEAMTRAPGA